MQTLPTVSTVPGVLSEIIRRLKESLPSEVTVCDGQPVPPEDMGEDLICIGFTGQEGDPAVENTLTREQLVTTPNREAYDITSVASSWRGEQTDMSLVREGAYALLSRVAEILGRDQTLGGKCGKARLTSEVLAQEQTSMGAVATVLFTIHVDAFTGR